MDILIVGCGWVGTYVAAEMLGAGHRIWATCTSPDKAGQLRKMGLHSLVADFDHKGPIPRFEQEVFDVAIISVPIKRKDHIDVASHRFTKLLTFLAGITFRQSFFFGSVGIYPKVSATIAEDTFSDKVLDDKLLMGESKLRTAYSNLNVLRLGGLFGLDRIMAKYFAGKICDIGYQTANSVHVVDVYGVIRAMIAQESQGKTYNLVCPEHPLKKDVIEASAAAYGYDLPLGYSETDKTAKVVSPERLISDLAYRFSYPSPLQF
ncbi:GDP-L-fucose synthase [Parapedobacter pyrenivorans]|uniref:GDP-L-fucose synthase n=1 Tax=Parapedobacter pyrenivorans TaxID=1305674 RepID=UPI003342ACE3